MYFNPADQDYPVAFNLFRQVPAEKRHLVASGVVGAMKSIWRDSWGPRLEYILYACCAALLECENVTILGIQRLLADRAYRDWVVRKLPGSYTMHDARHSFAVRCMKAAIDPQLIANNLGHRDATMVLRIYGNYRVTSADFRRARTGTEGQ